MFQVMQSDGVKWTYLPGRSYATKVGVWTIAIRRVITLSKKNWRLFVTSSGGGNLAWKCQFYANVKDARAMGVRLARKP